MRGSSPCPKGSGRNPGIEHASERIPDVRERIRFPRQRAGATHLDHSVLALARSSTFGRSAHGCAGAGGVRGCRIARWSMMKRVSGWRSITAVPASTLPQQQDVDRKSCFAAARATGRGPDQSLAPRSPGHHDADGRPRAGVWLPVGDDIATAGSSGSTGLTIAKRPGWARCTSTA